MSNIPDLTDKCISKACGSDTMQIVVPECFPFPVIFGRVLALVVANTKESIV